MTYKKLSTKKKNTDKVNTEVAILENGRTIFSAAKNDLSMFFPERDSWRNRFKYTMIEWAERETSLDLYSFCMEMRLPRRTLYDWIDKHPDIRELYEDVKLMIGCRRRLGALTRKFDKDVAFKDMYKYDPEWKEIDHHLQTIKNDLARNQSDVYIKMYAAPNTDVPVLEDAKKDLE